LEFNVPYQHKYGYIRDKMSGVESYPYPVTSYFLVRVTTPCSKKRKTPNSWP